MEISLFKNVFNILVCGVEEDAGQGDGLLETQIYSNDETTVQVAKRDRNVFLCYARSGATRGGVHKSLSRKIPVGDFCIFYKVF